MRCVRKLKMDVSTRVLCPVLEAEVGGSPWVRASSNSQFLSIGLFGQRLLRFTCSSFVLYSAAQSTVLFGFKSCQCARMANVHCSVLYHVALGTGAWHTSMAYLPRNVPSAGSGLKRT